MALEKSIAIDDVRRALAKPCPGLPSMLHMAPPYRSGIMPAEIVSPNHAGVLVLLYPGADALNLVLTRRTDQVDHHKGQISLPGGAAEPEDADYRATALREAKEELGVGLTDCDMLCSLSSLYIPPSNFYIYPAVAYCGYRPAFQPDPREVAELLEVPLAILLDPQTRAVERWTLPQYNNREVTMPFYRIGPHKVWGATAMVLAEFAAMLQEERR